MSVWNDDRTEDEVIIDEEINDVPEPDPVDIEEAGKDKIKELRDKLKECEQEKLSYLEELQRAKADFLNARKRLEEERERDKERAVNAHIEALLPLCDSFHMAMADKEAWAKAPEHWRKGVEGIHAQLQSILSAQKVTPVNPTGEVFDPNHHEALSNVPVEKETDHHKVMSVIQQGYQREINGKHELIRPARVTVGEHTKEGKD